MIVAANWKMNPKLAAAVSLASDYCTTSYERVTRILFAPHPYLVPIGVGLQGSGILLGGQDCHQSGSGAHTGDVSASMLRDCGASFVLLGHSERRARHGETSQLVAAKATQAVATGLSVMMCVGETLAEREAGNALARVLDQLENSIPDSLSNDFSTKLPATCLNIAYEPVWAIGSGQVATVFEIAEMHHGIRRWLDEAGFKQTKILYGGSVQPRNASEIFAVPHVDGALVGGASLVAADLSCICAAADRLTSS